MTSKDAETRKRKLKLAGDMIEKGVDISNELIDELPPEVVRTLSDMLGSQAAPRNLFTRRSAASSRRSCPPSYGSGSGATPSGRQRPRKFDSVAWQALGAAESATGLSTIQLLRTCLFLLAKSGVRRIDLQAALDEITKMVPERDRGPSDE